MRPEITQLSGCADGHTCPGAFLDRDGETVLVRGPADNRHVPRGEGEAVVRIPAELIAAAARVLTAGR